MRNRATNPDQPGPEARSHHVTKLPEEKRTAAFGDGVFRGNHHSTWVIPYGGRQVP